MDEFDQTIKSIIICVLRQLAHARVRNCRRRGASLRLDLLALSGVWEWRIADRAPDQHTLSNSITTCLKTVPSM